MIWHEATRPPFWAPVLLLNACKSCDEFYETAELPAEFQDKLLLPNKQNNGALWYEPEQDPKHPGHFKTFLAQREEFKTDRMKQIKPDSNISDGPALRCQEPDCLTTLRSKAMTKRHYSKLHNKMLQETKKGCMFASIKDATLDFQVTGTWINTRWLKVIKK